MVTVHIWRMKLGSYGHTSLEIKDEYISFYPAEGSEDGQPNRKKGKKKKGRSISSESTFSEDLQEDVDYMERNPDVSIEITGLNEDVILNFWLNEYSGSYNILKRNCSTIVAQALLKGAAQRKTQGIFKKIKTYFALIGSIDEILSGEIVAWTPIQVESLAKNINKYIEE